ncbi:hypothetical protein KM043_013316 [Ampulex compressa]|nr:hypothetical protein KM043_013316 [Ampulex compressa]
MIGPGGRKKRRERDAARSRGTWARERGRGAWSKSAEADDGRRRTALDAPDSGSTGIGGGEEIHQWQLLAVDLACSRLRPVRRAEEYGRGTRARPQRAFLPRVYRHREGDGSPADLHMQHPWPIPALFAPLLRR